MKIVVTGSAGFIGSHVVEELEAHGHEVFGIDLKDGKDIFDLASLPEADCVIHLAALPGVKFSVDNPQSCMRTNVEGTVRVLEVASLAGIRNFVFASSSTVYGGLSPYGISKRCGEELCERYATLYDMSVTALRLFSVYGPRMRKDLAMVRLADSILPEDPVFYVRGDPKETFRDYTFVKDAARAFRLAAEFAAKKEDGSFETFDICGGRPYSLDTVINLLSANLGEPPCTAAGGPTPGWEPKKTEGSNTQARFYLGWEPETKFEDGVRAFVEWWRKYRS